MEITAIIILIALLQYIVFVIRVGLSRKKYNVLGPKTTGNEIWERLFRIQQNTLEQLVIFIPGMVIFTMDVSEIWALLPGILFILGRQIYSGLYMKDPASRGPGMALSAYSNIGLVLAGLIGIGLQLFA